MNLSDIFKSKKEADKLESKTPEIEGLSDLIEAHLDMVSGGAYGRGQHNRSHNKVSMD